RLPPYKGPNNESVLESLLPYIEQTAVAQNFKYDAVIPVFESPADQNVRKTTTKGFGGTSYCCVTGGRTAADPNNAKVKGPFPYNTPVVVKFTSISDGLSNTLFFGPRPPSPDGQYGWWSYLDWDSMLAVGDITTLYLRAGNSTGAACPFGAQMW